MARLPSLLGNWSTGNSNLSGPAEAPLPRRSMAKDCVRYACSLGLAFFLLACSSIVPEPQTPTQATVPPTDRSPDEASGAASRAGDVHVLRAEDTVRAALLVPLTGKHAPLGRSLLNAATLAVFDIADPSFALIVRDTGGTPAGAKAALRSALDSGASLILGPLLAESAVAIAPEAQAVNVNVVTFSNNSAIAGNNLFTMGHLPRAQVDRVVDYASRQGLRTFGVLAPETPYGNAAVDALRSAVRRNDATISRVMYYSESMPDISAEVRALADYDARRQDLMDERKKLAARDDEASRLALTRLQDLDTLGEPRFDALMLPEGGARLLSIAPLLPFYDVDPSQVRFLGTALWHDQSLPNEPTLVGGWFAAPLTKSWDTFSQRYRASFEDEPPRLASLGYDAAALAIVLAKGANGVDDPFSSERLLQSNGFSGVDGIFRFLPSGEIERGLAVLEVRRDGFRVLDASPASFERLIN